LATGCPSRKGRLITAASISDTTVIASPASTEPTASNRSKTRSRETTEVSAGMGAW
jgi:hypothetical protein